MTPSFVKSGPAPVRAATTMQLRVLCTLAIFVALYNSGVPSMLYTGFAERWQLGASTVSAMFAVYALGAVATLLVTTLMARRWNRPGMLIVTGMVTIGVSALIMLLAQDVTWVYASRALAGIGTGLVNGSASAMLRMLEGSTPRADERAALMVTIAFTLGVTLGPACAGLLAAGGQSPATLPLGFVVLGSLAIVWGILRAGASIVPPPADAITPVAATRLNIGTYAFAIALLILSWSVGGLFMSLVPILFRQTTGLVSPLFLMLIIVLFQGSGGVTQILGNRYDMRHTVWAGLAALLASALLMVAGAQLGSAPTLLLATIMAGLGYGAVFMVATAAGNRAVPDGSRGRFSPLFYFFGYGGQVVVTMSLGIVVEGAGALVGVWALTGFVALCSVLLGLLASRAIPSVRHLVLVPDQA